MKATIDQKLKAYQAELIKQRKQFEIARRIVTPEGFFEVFFQFLKKYNTEQEAFDALNQLHYDTVLPPKTKYSNIETFRVMKNRYLNKK